MPESFLPPGGCCTPCADIPVTNVPGPTGAAGAAGAAGSNGVNAFTLTTAAFTVPAVDANVTVTVEATSWMGVGQFLFVVTAGIYEVVSITDTVTVVIQNTGATDNAAAAVVIALGVLITPSGPEGSNALTGAVGGTSDLKGTYPAPLLKIPNTLGDIIVGGGTDAATLTKGSNGRFLQSHTDAALDLQYVRVDLADTNDVENTLAILNGGTGSGVDANTSFNALSPVTTPGDIIFRNATVNARLGIGAALQVLRTNAGATAPEWGIPVGFSPMLVYEQRIVGGGNGGAAADAVWTVRILNSELIDTDGIGDLTVNQIELDAGTYRAEAYSPSGALSLSASLNVRHMCRLQNVTGAVELIRSITVAAPATAIAIGRFTIAAVQKIELQYFFEFSGASTSASDLGRNMAGEDVIYGRVVIYQES